jgi:hypothetical protein
VRTLEKMLFISKAQNITLLDEKRIKSFLNRDRIFILLLADSPYLADKS